MSNVTPQTTENEGCPQCGSPEDWDGASWCPACGYYPAVGQQVTTPEFEDQTSYDHWWEVIPAWAWLLASCVGAIFVLDVAVRIMFAESMMRTYWTFAQMGLGLIALVVVQFMAYLYSASLSDKMGPFDGILQPVAVWQPVFQKLPEKSGLVCVMGTSVAAIALAFFVVDGIDYVGFMEQDVAARKREKAIQAAKDKKEGKEKKKGNSAMGFVLQSANVMATAKQQVTGGVGGEFDVPADSLEDALGNFAGAASVDGLMAGGGGGDSAGGLGGALAGFTGAGGIDVDSYLQEQKTIATGSGDTAGEAGGLTGSVMNGVAGMTDGGSPNGDSSDHQKLTTDVVTGNSTSPVSTDVTNPSLEMPRPEMECLILGYTTNSKGHVRSLLVAAAPDRRQLRFVAKIPIDNIAPDTLAIMIARFPHMGGRRSVVRCPYGGRWLKPEMFCKVTYSGWTADSRLSDPHVESLLNVNLSSK